jgi:hypothetical protein
MHGEGCQPKDASAVSESQIDNVCKWLYNYADRTNVVNRRGAFDRHITLIKMR